MDLLEQFRNKPKAIERDKYKINIPVSSIEGNKGQKLTGEDNEANNMDELQQKLTGEDGLKIIDNTRILKKADNEKYNELRVAHINKNRKKIFPCDRCKTV